MRRSSEGESPPDIKRVGAFRSALGRHSAQRQEADRLQDEELAARVAQATFDQLQRQLADDQNNVDQWKVAHAARMRAMENDIFAYKAERYERGIKRVADLMAERLNTVQLDDLRNEQHHPGVLHPGLFCVARQRHN